MQRVAVLLLLFSMWPTPGGGLAPSAPDRPDAQEQSAASPAQQNTRTDQKPTSSPTDRTDSSTDQNGQPAKKEKRGSFVVAPLPTVSPALGAGVIPVLGYIFPFSRGDTVSPPSVVGAAGLITDDGSRGFLIGTQLYMKENRYEIEAAFANGNLNYNLYGGDFLAGLRGAKLPLKQDGRVFFGEGMRNVGHKLFIGPRVWIGSSVVTIRHENKDVMPPPDIALHSELVALGLVATATPALTASIPRTGAS